MTFTCPNIFKGTKGQQFRDFTRKNLSKKPWWRVFVALFFTILHDVAGLFSASSSILGHVHWFPHPWQNLFLIYVVIIFFDCVSEIMLVIYHDNPLCNRKPLNWTVIHVALGGQIITGFLWLGLMCLVAYSALFTVCPLDQNFGRCQALIPGVSEALVVFIVFIKNAMLLKEYQERKGIYPIICSEEVLYLHHFMHNDPEKITKDFRKFHSLGESDDIKDLEQIGCTSKTPFNVVFNFFMLILFDIAAIASVSSLIIEPGDEPYETFLRAIPFVLIVFFDIFSEFLILKYHDLPLIRQDEKTLNNSKRIFSVARTIQVMCFLAWLGSLIYMIFSVTTLSCHELCACSVPNPDVSCIASECNGIGCEGGSCVYHERGYCQLISNDTIQWEKPIFGQNFTYLSNCSVHVTYADCVNSSPTWTSCILLGLVLFDSVFQIGQMFFRSYIYPITIPEYVLFLAYWERGTLDKMIVQVGKNEFGVDWDPSNLVETLIEYEDTLVELDLGDSVAEFKSYKSRMQMKAKEDDK